MNRNLNRRIHPIAEANGLSPKFHRDIQIVENSVCRYFNISSNDLSSKKRNTDTTMARGFAIYILHTSFGYSASKLAAEYRRTPRAVFWHVDKISHLIKQRAYKEMYQTIISDLNH